MTIHSFGVMVVVALLAGRWLAARLARSRGLPGEFFLDAAIPLYLLAAVGARLLFVILNWPQFAGSPAEMLAVWRGGMSFHGVLLAVPVGWWMLRRRGLPAAAFLDAAAPGLALGYAIGRIGCFLNGCCYGASTAVPWGVAFPDGLPGLRYHPAQLYASAINLVLAGLLIAAHRRRHRAGEIALLYALGYSLYRFGIEFLRRGVTARELLFGLTEAQVFSLCVIAVAAAGWFWVRRHGVPAPEAPVTSPTARPQPVS